MQINKKKQEKRKLIKLQNKLGKKAGRALWLAEREVKNG